MPKTKSKAKADGSDKPEIASSSFHDDNVWEDDVEPPPSDGDEEDEDDEFVEVEKAPSDADDDEGSPKGNSGGRLGAAALEFSSEELPLLGYTIASFVFFLAAVTRRQKRAASMDLGFSAADTSPVLNYNDILGDVYSDNALEEDDSEFAEALSQSIIQQCEASYNALCGSNSLLMGAMGVYGNGLPSGHFAYALCLGIFGALMGGGVIFWNRTSASKNVDRVVDENDDTSEGGDDGDERIQSQSGDFLQQYRWLINGVLLLWAGIGWAVFTLGRSEVFAYTGNGFFALWAMILCAVWNFGITPDVLIKESENTDSVVYGLVATSVVAIIELTTGIVSWRFRSNKGIAAYALAVSVIAIVYGLVTAGFSIMAARNGTDKLDAKIGFWIVLVVFVMSILSAFLTTFIGPFLTTGNGYFAVWGSVLFSGLACSKLRKEMQQDMA